jgi:hypothetical protein
MTMRLPEGISGPGLPLLLLAGLAAAPVHAGAAPAGQAELEAAARRSLPVAGRFASGQPRRWTPERGRTLSLLPVRFQPAAPSFVNQRHWCALAIGAAGRPAETIVTVGTDWTGTVSCNGLREAGELPTARGVPRFALVYAASSPNTQVAVPVILRWNAASGRAELDEEASRRVDEAGQGGSLAAIRVALRPR